MHAIEPGELVELEKEIRMPDVDNKPTKSWNFDDDNGISHQNTTNVVPDNKKVKVKGDRSKKLSNKTMSSSSKLTEKQLFEEANQERTLNKTQNKLSR